MKKFILIIILLCTFNVYADVSDRTLAILASLAYEDVPQKVGTTLDYGESKICSYEQNSNYLGYHQTMNTCYFYDDHTTTKDTYTINKYIEGMSARKINLFSLATSTIEEPGAYYYFLNGVDESEYADWIIDAYYEKNNTLSISDTAGSWEGKLSVITFKKGNDYVIAYRGTDFPDVLEWLTDIEYATGKNAQTEPAFNYAISEYKRITASNSNANIYVTGHSLGAYLAQIGGAAITLYETENGLLYNSRLAKVEYFNGMGIDLLKINSGVKISSTSSTTYYLKDLKSALAALSIQNRDGSVYTKDEMECRQVSWSSNACASGRLVLYRTEGDPVSTLGLHYGIINEVTGSSDAITNHAYSHNISLSDGMNYAVSYIKANVQSVKEKIQNHTVSDNINSDLSDAIIAEELNDTSDLNTDGISLNIDNVLNTNPNKDKINSLFSEARNLYDFNILYDLNTIGNALKTVLIDVEKLYGQSGGLTSLIEGMNVAHETDSLTCLIDGNRGIPTELLINTNAYLYENNIYYAKDSLDISVQAKNGCIYNYEFKENDNSLYNGKLGFNTVSNTSGKHTYEVVGTYGVKTKELIYNYEGDLVTNYETISTTGSINKSIDVIYDNSAPVTSNISTIEVTNGWNKESNITFDEDINNYSIKLSTNIYVSASAICTGNSCTITVVGKNPLVSNSKTLNATLNVCDKLNNCQDYNVPIKWSKTSTETKSLNKTVNDNVGPDCTFTSFSSSEIKVGNTATINLVCKDSNGITTPSIAKLKTRLTSSPLLKLSIKSVSLSEKASNSVTYRIEIKGLFSGKARLVLRKNTFKDSYNNYNKEITSEEINIKSSTLKELLKIKK